MSQEFYDELARHYHLIFDDWQQSIDRQAAALDTIIREEWGPSMRTVLDAAAGIGTQSLGLAARGYEVTASDISPVAMARCRQEADKRGLRIATATADLRRLSRTHGRFDLVLACDNAVPHLLTDEDILEAFRECAGCLRPGGGLVISSRDYRAPGTGTELHPYGVRAADGGRYILFQTWDWDGPWYDVSFYVLFETEGRPIDVHVSRGRYYAVPVRRLMELMREAGFRNVHRSDGTFFQPVVVGTARAEEDVVPARGFEPRT